MGSQRASDSVQIMCFLRVHRFVPRLFIPKDIDWDPLEIRFRGEMVLLQSCLINMPDCRLTEERFLSKVIELSMAKPKPGTYTVINAAFGVAPCVASTLRLSAQLRNNTLPLVTDVGRFNIVTKTKWMSVTLRIKRMGCNLFHCTLYEDLRSSLHAAEQTRNSQLLLLIEIETKA